MSWKLSSVPPAGIYEIGIVSWLDTGTDYAVTFRPVNGPFRGYSFRDSFRHMAKTRIEKLGRGLWDLINQRNGFEPTTASARLVRRIVNGVDTLGIKSWGWR